MSRGVAAPEVVNPIENIANILHRFCPVCLFCGVSGPIPAGWKVKISKAIALMATPTGFEPVTYRLGGGRSIQLSYGARTCWAIPRIERRVIPKFRKRWNQGESMTEPNTLPDLSKSRSPGFVWRIFQQSRSDG